MNKLLATDPINEYIIKWHEQSCTWLQENIKKNFGVLLNSSTIRGRKRSLKCLTNKSKKEHAFYLL